MNTYGCAQGVLRGMCAYLWVCTGGVEGMCVNTYGCALGVLREYLWVCARGVEGDV